MKITLLKLKQIIRDILKEKENTIDINLKYLKQYIKKNNIIQDDIIFMDPNFEFEWNEAKRYKIFNLLGKNFYLDRARQGYILKTSDIKGKLSNTDLDNSIINFNNINFEKRERFLKALKKRIFERSIALKLSDDRYELLAGNTRLTGLDAIGFEQEIWIIDLSDIVNNCLKEKYLDNYACEELIGLL